MREKEETGRAATNLQLWDQKRETCLNQEVQTEALELLQAKEEQKEVFTSQEGEQLALKQQTETSLLIAAYEESDSCGEKDLYLNTPETKSEADEVSVSGMLLSASKGGSTEEHVEGNIHISTVNIPLLENQNNPDVGKKSFKCVTCGKAFRHESKFNMHMRSHTGEHMIYPKQFDDVGRIKEQTNVYTGEGPYLCNICGKRFLCKTSLPRHLKIHTGYKPHVCPFCGKRFIRKTEWRYHLRIHTGEKPFTCTTCGRAFRSRDLMNTHMKTHRGEKTFL